ncbi:MAG: YigZ family protein [Schaedlerella sp.]|nr:YigZ family protein [Schaedlerella sp.]
MDYRTVEQEARAEIIEKKSRFIAELYPVSSEEEVLGVLEKVRKKYWDARHHCWAFVIGKEQPLERCSDDGEPSGTAGKPILEVIRGAELRNVLIVVTRYFGGTLLGTGGLVRAYTASSKEAVAAAEVVVKISGYKLKIKTDYTGLGKIQYLLAQRGLEIVDSEYAENVILYILISKEDEQGIIKELTEATNAQAEIERAEACIFSAKV